MSFPSFPEFFSELNRDSDNKPLAPFPWQTDLAQRAVSGNWPDFIAAPTGSGKTAALEVAIYALAAQAHLPPAERNAPRRIFFIVNRRVIVDEAFERASRIAVALTKPGSDRPACQAVADALLSLNPAPLNASDFPRIPLDCVQLRGAIYRDQRWARSLLQPTIIATTIDQVGSRLLFRGYGVTPNACPIHAALVASDALWLLDEAHISRPFAETVEHIQRFRNHHLKQQPEAVRIPNLHWVQLTATPPQNAKKTLHLSQADLDHPVLSRRLTASKPAKLAVCESKAKAKQIEDLAARLIDEATKITQQPGPRSLAIMVNRVATARLVAEKLMHEAKSKKARFRSDVTLLIGRMRPVDRDTETSNLQTALRSAATQAQSTSNTPDTIKIVVATQCLEVGADLDFDALVTECASLDALRQRFGRLNRTGRDIAARATILMPHHLIETNDDALDKQTQKKELLDPIYGNALSATWNWLQSVASGGTVDFSISAIKKHTESLPGEQIARLNAPTSHAPVIFPAYLEAWAQTSPFPCPTPDPAPFLHGSQPSRPDVLVVWRADLSADAKVESLIHDISLCPPSQSEALPVPLHVFRSWLFTEDKKSAEGTDTGDLFSETIDAGENEQRPGKAKPIGTALLWKGVKGSRLLQKTSEVFPGATIILPASIGGWSQLGHIPNAPIDPSILKPSDKTLSDTQFLEVDRAEEAFQISKDRAILRIHPQLLHGIHGGEAWQRICNHATNPEEPLRTPELRNALLEASEDDQLEPLHKTLKALVDLDFDESRYADEKGIVLTTRKRLRQRTILEQAEDDLDDLSRTRATKAITLTSHTRHVVDLASVTANALGLPEKICTALLAAAELHDLGKADPRFQALLLGGNPHAAYALSEPIAKSAQKRSSGAEYKQARLRAGLPEGFRHEMTSVQIAEKVPGELPNRILLLHLIAAHHGYARPFAPVNDDLEPPTIHAPAINTYPAVSLTTGQQTALPPHQIDSGIPERFWLLLRQHGPWGLAFLEAILRLADQQASEAESEGWYAEATPAPAPSNQS